MDDHIREGMTECHSFGAGITATAKGLSAFITLGEHEEPTHIILLDLDHLESLISSLLRLGIEFNGLLNEIEGLDPDEMRRRLLLITERYNAENN